MNQGHPPDLDLDAAHLRPPQRGDAVADGGSRDNVADRIPWEGSRRPGIAAAYIASWWRIVRSPVAIWAAVPARGGARRPWTFALFCGGVFGVISELMDSVTVALIRFGGGDTALAEVFQLDIAGRSLDWLPISLLSAAGCLFAVLIGAPLYVLFYSVLVVAWTTVLHLLLKLTGGLAASEAGFQGTLRAVCYSQVAMAAAIVPWIGDPIAILWSFVLQVPGLIRMHRCSRARAALAVGLPAAALVLVLLLVVFLAEPETAAG